MSNPFEIGPLAPERNPPINPQFYTPRQAVISAIAPVSQTITQVETVEPNQMVVGQLVRFVIAPRCGVMNLNEQQAYVTQVLDDETFYVEIDTRDMNPFNPSANSTQDSFVIPIGDTNTVSLNTSGRINNNLYIKGSFINISPE